MQRGMLLYKVVGIIGITLFVGFSAMGLLALWLEYQATIELNVNNSRTLAAIVTKNITDAMMKDDSSAINVYVAEMKARRFLTDLTVFTIGGVDTSSRGSEKNQDIIRAVATGIPQERTLMSGESHLLDSVILLPNEKRCNKCHDAAPRFLGAVQLKTSLDAGYQCAESAS